MKRKEEDSFEQIDNFDDMNLKYELLRGIYAHGLEKPSRIQSKSILALNSSRDVMLVDRSGTGKTMISVISMLQNIDEQQKEIQGLILAPTRDLATCIHSQLSNLSKYMNITSHLCIDGILPILVKDSIKLLSAGNIQVVIGTVGKVEHFMESRFMDLSNVKMVVMDEVDEILSFGFMDQARNIMTHLPVGTQICVNCATVSKEVQIFKEDYMNYPILIERKASYSFERVKQFYMDFKKIEMKFSALIEIYKMVQHKKYNVIVYVNTEESAKDLLSMLQKEKLNAFTLENEETDQTGLLIAVDPIPSDMNMRGNVRLMINYEINDEMEIHIERLGIRSNNRFGGHIGINFTTKDDFHLIEKLKKYHNIAIEELPENYNDFY